MKANVGTVDQAIRVLLGLGLLSLLFILEGSLRWIGLIGVVLLVTASMSWCPAYGIFGIKTNKSD